MAEQMTFVISRKGDRWWGRTFCAPNWSVFSDERAEVEQACREFVAKPCATIRALDGDSDG